MVTIEDKIESFKKIIKEDIKEKSELEIQEILEETKKQVQDHKAKKYEEIELLKRNFVSKLETKSESIHSKILKEGKEIILNTNKSIYEDFFKNLREQLKTDYMGVMGENYVRKQAESIHTEIRKDMVVYVFEPTFERDKNIIQGSIGDIPVQKSSSIKIGGFEIENQEKTYRFNFSLDSLLDSKYTDILSSLKEALEVGA
ncbi:MAG: V-type ATP synthase subunit E [Filifactoraceae bacterium]